MTLGPSLELIMDMKWIAFFLTFSIAIGASAASPRCEDVFHSEKKTSSDLTLVPNFDISYQKSEQVQGIDGASNGYLRTVVHHHSTESGDMIRTDVFDFFPSPVKSPRNNRYQKLVEENIRFVVGEYSQRRDWSPDYLEAIRKDAFLFAERSTYIVARRQKSVILEAPGDIIGTMKVIRGDRDHKLPFEIDHGIEVPLNNGRKFEPGNLVVLKEESALAFGEVMSHFVRFAKELQKEPGHNPDQMIFFTDADRASSIMYRQLGFSPVPGFEAPLVRNGKEYFLIGASTSTILKFPKVFEAKRHEWESGGALAQFTRIPGRMPLRDMVIRFDKIKVETGGDSQYTPQQRKILTQHSVNLYSKEDGQGGRTFTLRRDYGLGKFLMNFELTSRELPLREGVIRDVSEDGYSTKVTYLDEILDMQYHRLGYKIHMRLKTNPDFSDIQGIYYEQKNGRSLDVRVQSLSIPEVHTFP